MIHYPYFGIELHAIGYFFLIGALIFTVWSGADYFVRFRNLLKIKDWI
jgi:CDP-diacylglycerol--glycerol-3-phosphate 3-phosphatidyltransferase